MLSDDNKEAVKSSVMVGLAYAMIGGGVTISTGKDWWWVAALVLFVVGLITGLATTWYHEESE